MAEFVESLSSLEPSLHSIETGQGLDLMSHFDELSGNVMENPSLCLMGISNDNFLPFLENFSVFPVEECLKPVAASDQRGTGENKRKAETVSDANSRSSSVIPSETLKKLENSSGSVKRGRSCSKEEDKLKEVVHLRARRGQATDSHSLAERVRREKINERMRCLQDLVPGCFKTMGMAGVLDEIINYVQSLQNQVEFLSMKLSVASSYYDFNLDMETTTLQQLLPKVGDAYQTLDLEKLIGEGYGSCTTFQSAMYS